MIAKLHAGCLVINIDESSFGRSVKQNYAWLPKNQSSGIVNVGALGRTTLIFALMSTGSWIGLLVNETVTGQDFNVFLYLLRIYIDSTFKDLIGKAIVTIDNASIHLTADNKKTAAKYGFEMLGLPPYWPHLAPVEYVFGMIKGYIRNKSFSKELDYSNASGKEAIVSGLALLSKEKAQRMWTKIAKTARIAILEGVDESYKYPQELLRDSKRFEEDKEI